MKKTRPVAWVGRGLLILLAAGLLYLGWCGVRAGLYARLALADVDRLQSVAENPSLDNLSTVQADVAALETHLLETRRAAGPFLALASRLGWLPRYGQDIAGAPALLDMAVELAAGGRQTLEVLAPLAGKAAEGGGLAALPEIAEGLRAGGPQLAAAEAHFAAAEELRTHVVDPGIDRVASLLHRLDGLLPLASDGLKLAQLVPALLGEDGERTYLVFAQNSDELRGTGGFISGVGIVRFENGGLADMKFGDSYSVDNWEVPYPDPPRPLQEQMGLQLWLVRDSNWSPDFPQAAEVGRALYAQSQGVWADGVIALDLEAVRLLVGALGSLQVDGAPEPITGDNALAWMKAAWQAPPSSEGTVQEVQTSDWWSRRKDFMGQLVGAALAKVQSGADLDYIALAKAARKMLEERHLQLYIDDPAAATVLAENSWDGAIRPLAGADYLAVVDSNVGYNKANALVQTRVDYTVEPSEQGLIAELTITYNHTAPRGSEEVCDRSPRYGDSYDALARRCYWDYLRVYVPGDAELLDSSGLKQTLSGPGEGGTTVFEGDFVLPTGEEHTVTLRYRLPAAVGSEPYRLFVRKQAGATPAPTAIHAGSCRAETELTADYVFECPSLAP